MDWGKVAVLMGGWGGEREVSLQSGSAVLNALKSLNIMAESFDPALRPLEDLKNFNRAFIALHGSMGENGTVQGVLEYLGIPYTGSGILASAVGMDKWRTKLIWEKYALPTPPAVLLNEDFENNFEKNAALTVEKLGLPLFIKPAREGSSLGVSRVEKIEDFLPAYQKARRLDSFVLAEKAIQGGEYTVAVLGKEALPIIQIIPQNAFYDYEAKYQREDTQYLCPAPLPEDLTKTIQEEALKAFYALNGKGWGRVDFLMDEEGRHYFLEINTVPGMTSHSLVPMAAKVKGFSFPELVLKILFASLEGEKE